MKDKKKALKGPVKILFFCLKILIIMLFLFIFAKAWKDEASRDFYKTAANIFPGPGSAYIKYLSVDKGAVIGDQNSIDGNDQAKIFSIPKAEYLALKDKEWKLFQNNLKYIYYKRYSYVSLIFEDGSGIQFRSGKKAAAAGQIDDKGIIAAAGARKVNPRTLEEDNGSN